MGYRNLRQCVLDLEKTGQLIRIDNEVDPYLEAAEIQRRVYQARGPAIFFSRVKGCAFPMVSNLYGSVARTRFLFRDTLRTVQKLIDLKVDPARLFKAPWRYWNLPLVLPRLRPRWRHWGPVRECQTTLRQLPQLVSWPQDGGAFVTLPCVYTEHPGKPGWRNSNLGMYRIQLSGNHYDPDREVGMHYQLHRGIGVHHATAIARGESLAVNVVVGGPPVLALAAVLPLPEGMPELAFAGILGGRRLTLCNGPAGTLPIPAEADFCIQGVVDPRQTKLEGPFGDHLGYYSLAHPFPVLKVQNIWHRRDAIWPFTVVGRPPQEDTSFGAIIHEITGPVIPATIPGVHAVHAVDAAGVHPLLLAIGSERYTPFTPTRKPRELLTCAHAILGQGQLSLAKYLLIAAHEDNPQLDLQDIPAFFKHMLERVDWRCDLHFQTCTTMDTLDYSGTDLNEGSKVIIAAAGPPRRQLGSSLPGDLIRSSAWVDCRLVLPGILAVQLARGIEPMVEGCCVDDHFPLIVVCDDAEFCARSLQNFLWVTFTRSNPAVDIDGYGSSIVHKHWGCTGPLVIDARSKPHHAPPLLEDPQITRRVDQLAAPGGPLHGII